MSDLTAKYQTIQGELEDFILARQKLETQLQENKIVQDEFKSLNDDAPIYKLTGNVLLPVEHGEAHSNVEKRLEFINQEIKRCEDNIKGKQDELDKVRAEIMKARQ
ncbi:prefoldin subunit 6 [Monosporozyma servazzii]